MEIIDEIRNNIVEEIEQIELMSKKHKKVCTTLNYIEHFLILPFTVSEYISMSAFLSLVGISMEITNSAIGEKEKKHKKIVLLAKNKLNSIEVLISKFLNNSSISHDEFVLVNNVLKENDIAKKETKNLKASTVHQRF